MNLPNLFLYVFLFGLSSTVWSQNNITDDRILDNLPEKANDSPQVEGMYEAKTGELTLFTFGIMMPLQLAVSTYLLETEIQKSFGKDFFPLFGSGGGDYILIHLNKNEDTFCKLSLFSPAVLLSDQPMTIYDSLTSMFLTISEVYKRGGYYFNSLDNLVEVVDDIEESVAKTMNPDSEFWKNS